MFYIIIIEEPTPHLMKQVAEWISSNLSVFCFLYPYLQFSFDKSWGKYIYQNVKRCNYFELLGKVGDVSLLLHDIQLI